MLSKNITITIKNVKEVIEKHQVVGGDNGNGMKGEPLRIDAHKDVHIN